MKAAGICLLIIGGILLFASGMYFVIYWLFEKMPDKTARTFGRSCAHKYKNDVAVWTGGGKGKGLPRIAFMIKHLTRAKYVYSVNNKLYFCAFEFFRKPRGVPDSCAVIYLKAFPRISYLDHEDNCIGALDFFIKGIMLLMMAVCAFALGAALLGRV